MAFLDNIPLASILAIAGIVGALIALVVGDIEFDQFMLAIGATTGGAGVLGVARAQSGKGVRR